MIYILSPESSSRLEYTLDFIFCEVLQFSFSIIHDQEDFISLEGPKIAYQKNNTIEQCMFIPSSGFLFEEGIQTMEFASSEGPLPKIFYQPGEEVDFDIFSAIFYIVSRYEEYLPAPRDEFGRFNSSASILHKLNALERPIVDEYIMYLADRLCKSFNINFNYSNYSFLPTYDIDMVYAFKGRGFFRTTGGFARSILKADFSSVAYRLQVLNGIRKDPFDTFDYIDSINSVYDLSPVYFFHVGNYSKYDKNISIHNKEYRNIITEIANNYRVGIHPSFESNRSGKILEMEIKRLSEITGKVDKSRQHFLKFSLPSTFLNLELYGIKEEYSMGYADRPGFRAGTCHLFRFYDLENERKTEVNIIPFQVMDTSFNNYMDLNPEEAERVCKNIIDQVKKVKGTFVSLWHNNSLSDFEEWQGWKGLYESIVEYAK